MKRTLFFTSLLCLRAFAGWEFVSETRTTDAKGKMTQKMIVKSTVDGENGKFIFEECTGSPLAATGNYLVTTDGGKTIYNVDPVKKTYSPFNLDEMLKLAGSMMNMAQGMVKMEFSDPVIEILEEKAGEEMQGLPTSFRKIRTTYEMQMKIIGMTRLMDIETVEESWTTNKLGDTAFGAWLRTDPAPTGNEDLDRLISTQMKEMKGYPLKMVQATTTTTWNKQKTKVKEKSTTQNQTVVTHLEKKNIDASSFKIPDDYVLSQPEQEKSGMGSLKDIFKSGN